MDSKWLAPVGKCDLCGTDLLREKKFYDANIRGGCWGLICKDCFQMNGCKLGTGLGQEFDSKTRVKTRG